MTQYHFEKINLGLLLKDAVDTFNFLKRIKHLTGFDQFILIRRLQPNSQICTQPWLLEFNSSPSIMVEHDDPKTQQVCVCEIIRNVTDV